LEIDFYNLSSFYNADLMKNSFFHTGLASQHLEYFPFGETFVEENVGSFFTRYKFNAKEQDSESDLYFYGARYYDPKTSVWLGVDPMADKYPGLSPFVYCANNPIILVDPDGRAIWITHKAVVGDKTVIQMVRYSGGKLFNANGSEYKGSNQYLRTVQKQLSEIKTMDKSVNNLVTDLEDCKLIHHIWFEPNEYSKIGDNNSPLYDNIMAVDTEDGKKLGSGSVTNFDPYNTDDDPRAVLAHELSHASDNDNATEKKGNTRTGVPLNEVDAVKIQNKILKRLGLPIRKEYGGLPIPEELL